MANSKHEFRASQDDNVGAVVLSVTDTLSACLAPATFHFNLYRPSVSVLSAQNCDVISEPSDQMICVPTEKSRRQQFCVDDAPRLEISSLHFMKPLSVAPVGVVSFEFLKPQSSYASAVVTM